MITLNDRGDEARLGVSVSGFPAEVSLFFEGKAIRIEERGDARGLLIPPSVVLDIFAGERVIAIDLCPKLKVGRQQAGVPKSRSMISETENPRPYDLGFYGGRYRD